MAARSRWGADAFDDASRAEQVELLGFEAARYAIETGEVRQWQS